VLGLISRTERWARSKLLGVNLRQSQIPLRWRMRYLTERIVTPFAALSLLGGGSESSFNVLLCLVLPDEAGLIGMLRMLRWRIVELKLQRLPGRAALRARDLPSE
jgi:hypothetical protein